MTAVSQKRSEELFREYNTPIIKIDPKNKPIDCFPTKPIQQPIDKIDIKLPILCVPPIMPNMDIFGDSKVENIRKDILSGKGAHINAADFPGKTTDEIVKMIFPDAVKISNSNRYSSNYFSEETGKITINHESGCFGPLPNFSIRQSRVSLEDLRIEPQEEQPIKLPSITDLLEKQKAKKFENITKELETKGSVYVKHSDFPDRSNEEKIKAIFPDATIISSKYEWPSISIKFADKKGNTYELNDLVNGIVASQGVTITKA